MLTITNTYPRLKKTFQLTLKIELLDLFKDYKGMAYAIPLP